MKRDAKDAGDELLDDFLFDVQVLLAVRRGVNPSSVTFDEIEDHIEEHWDDAEYYPPLRQHARFVIANHIDRETCQITDAEIAEILADDAELKATLVDYYRHAVEEHREMWDPVVEVVQDALRRH